MRHTFDQARFYSRLLKNSRESHAITLKTKLRHNSMVFVTAAEHSLNVWNQFAIVTPIQGYNRWYKFHPSKIFNDLMRN